MEPLSVIEKFRKKEFKIGKILTFPTPISHRKLLFLLDENPETKDLIRSLHMAYPESRIQTKPGLLWDEAEAVITINGITPFLMEWFVQQECRDQGIPWIRCKAIEDIRQPWWQRQIL